MIRVLIVDDSVVFRKILQEALSKKPQLKVVGTATNGKEALKKIRVLRPDITILDVEMPEMDGLSTLEEIKRQKLNTIVIMFSTLTSQGAKTTLEALSKGATDFVPKPSGTGAFAQSVKTIQDQLIPKIITLGQNGTRAKIGATPIRSRQFVRPNISGVSTNKKAASTKEPAMRPSMNLAKKPTKVDAIGIGVSTGGPNALNEVIPRFPSNFKIPIFIVQHMPPVFTAQLASRLNQKSKLNVVEAQDNAIVQPGTVYIAPGDFHMTVIKEDKKYKIKLNQDPPENSCRPAVDVLFRSLAKTYKDKVLAAVLTGMGQDGLEGAKALKKTGAFVIAQDKQTSVVWGMPKFVAEAGLADRVVPLGNITTTILELSGHRY